MAAYSAAAVRRLSRVPSSAAHCGAPGAGNKGTGPYPFREENCRAKARVSRRRRERER